MFQNEGSVIIFFGHCIVRTLNRHFRFVHWLKSTFEPHDSAEIDLIVLEQSKVGNGQIRTAPRHNVFGKKYVSRNWHYEYYSISVYTTCPGAMHS